MLNLYEMHSSTLYISLVGGERKECNRVSMQEAPYQIKVWIESSDNEESEGNRLLV